MCYKSPINISYEGSTASDKQGGKYCDDLNKLSLN